MAIERYRKEMKKANPKSNNTFFFLWILIGLLSLKITLFIQLPHLLVFLQELVSVAALLIQNYQFKIQTF